MKFTYGNLRISSSNKQKGFTLVEMMIVTMIVALLAAIAVPSYRSFMITNAEAEAKSEMLSLSNELEQWRAKALTYQGFVPKNLRELQATDPLVTAYQSNGSISVPTINPKYTIQLGQLTGNPAAFTPLTSATGRGTSWTMVAGPTSRATGGQNIKLSSNGIRCQVIGTSSIDITTDDCGTGEQSW